jgi:YD repeat-containing protein
MRSWIRRLERDARGHLESFELLDGSTYYYDPYENLQGAFHARL